jgi:hypothetical protein
MMQSYVRLVITEIISLRPRFILMTEALAAHINAADAPIVPSNTQVPATSTVQADRQTGIPRQEQRGRDKRRGKNTNRAPGGDAQERQGRTQSGPRDEPRKTIEVQWPLLIEAITSYNERPSSCWEVCRIFETDRVYLQLQRKDLSEIQIEIFEDDRVTGPVMRGERPPTVDDYWRRLYREEVKVIQSLLPVKDVWMAETPPEKKSSLRWGPAVPRPLPVDRDSQEFFLQKQQKTVRRDDGSSNSRRRHTG